MGGSKRGKGHKKSSAKHSKPAAEKHTAEKHTAEKHPVESALYKRLTRRDFLKKAALGAAGVGIAAYALNRTLFYKGSHELSAESHVFSGDAPKEAWKWSKEAYHYMNFGKDVQCLLCPNHCRLSPGDRSICRVRVNIGGKLYSLAYGNPCSVHVDPIEKKPLYHFLPTTKVFSIATAGCNFRCLNCQNWQISQFKPEETANVEMFPDAVVQNALQAGSKSVAYTYSEPSVFYEYMYDTSKIARQHGLRNVWVTNGFMNPEPLTQLCEVLDAANIDLKSFSDETYSKLNAGALRPVLDSIKLCAEKKVWTEVTWLTVPTWSDDMDMIRRGMEWLYKNIGPEYPVHFSRFTPLYRLTGLPMTPVSTLESARKVAMDAGMKYVYIGNVPGHDAENTYCPKCGKIVIKRRGYSVDLSGFQDGACRNCGEPVSGVWK
ncbi:AmmeMemoRadiSam system radical SAM enzyme [Candidatus Woesearchaeota archaeon]|nr:AmmeMemoRadiSam system radical SAM enzyme [Candidatus Woesearchaeota archaeon]